MPKISGLGVGEIKKMSGVGIGSVKKVSGLGLGSLWQDNIQRGMYKNGNQAIPSSNTLITGWLPEDANSSVTGGNELLIPSSGNYILQINAIVSESGFSGTAWVQFMVYKNGAAFSPAVSGPQISYNRGTSGNVYSYTHPTPVALLANDLLSARGISQTSNVVTLTGGADTWIRAIPT